MAKVLILLFTVLFLPFCWSADSKAQPVLPSDLKKPKKFENKKLGAEKSAEKKFRGPRRFIQNTVTHYNWHFNANNKMNEILERAKLAHREDYSQLLPFYNYSLRTTAADKNELDSVIHKANTGILIHDLRNAWIDNLYMLMGKAYFFRNDLDSAYLTFQHINYAFAPKEEDGYDIPIGSNANEGNNALSVSTREKSGIVRRTIATPPSRNESFIWQIRTFLASEQPARAASLIQTLRNDPNFPERLETDLYEMQALWFYRQKIYDSAAYYLEKALPNATDRQESSRWEYLIAQLYEQAGNAELATLFYERAKKRTLDPVLEVYAILNGIRQKTSDSVSTEKSVEELKKMGKRDRYSKYRDIIYYTAAQIELDRNNIHGAKAMLHKATSATAEINNPAQRTRAFLLLADLLYHEKNFSEAKRFYDSVNNNDPGVSDPIAFDQRKETVHQIVDQLEIINRQDSLQHLAAMPEADRNALLKKMARQLRRNQGIKDEEELPGNAAVNLNNRNNQAPDMFPSARKGEWYFSNASLKSKGFSAFRQTWGNRPNVDNWRRAAAMSLANNAGDGRNANTPAGSDTSAGSAGEITVEALLRNIPLTAELMEVSKDSIGNAMIELGILFINKLEDLEVAIDTLEHFIQDHPYNSRVPEALYYLYYAYQKTGQESNASRVYQELQQKFSGTAFQQKAEDAFTGKSQQARADVTHDYEQIYNLFIEGNFDAALAHKKMTDSIYGSSYWTPQLLYIEAVFHLQQRDDPAAKGVLGKIIEVFPDDPMAEKAKTILEVLGRRKEIEEYLTNLQITHDEDSVSIAGSKPLVPEQIGTPMIQDSTTIQPIKQRVIDTLQAEEIIVAQKDSVLETSPAQEEVGSVFVFNPETPHAVMILLTKVDPVYVTESRNAFNRYNSTNFGPKQIDITNQVLNDSVRLVVMTGFENAADAMAYLNKTAPIASKQIVPWLPAGKYFFQAISVQNLEVLKNNQDLDGYRRFHERYFPQ